MSGYVLHSDAERVIIATTKSDNAKTGNMIQIWILRNSVSPVEAVRDGSDAAICGDCKHRGTDGFKGRACYVNVAQGPNAVYRAYKAGKYPYLDWNDYPRVFTGRTVRFGAYGDPVHIPLGILGRIADLCTRHTGYTHQWHNPDYRWYRKFLMASVDSEVEYWSARIADWRCFRVRAADSEPISGKEIMCPAADETGHKTTCARCGLCNGRVQGDKRKDVCIIVHGIGKKNLIQIGVGV